MHHITKRIPKRPVLLLPLRPAPPTPDEPGDAAPDP
jgi:hypothetical protein